MMQGADQGVSLSVQELGGAVLKIGMVVSLGNRQAFYQFQEQCSADSVV